MSEERKANILRIAGEAWNMGNLDALDEISTTECIRHRTPFPDIEGLDAHKEYIASIRITYPDFHLTIHELIIEGDIVVSRWSWTGTHSGESGTPLIPPTGKQVTVSGCSVTHTLEGKAVEEWSFSDNLGLMQQLGVVPPMG
jgi:predicted ester cyclase